MITTITENYANKITSPVRTIKARVAFFEDAALVNPTYYDDRLISYTIERVGEDSKFFGFGIVQKANIKLIDKNRELNFTTANRIKIYPMIDGEAADVWPSFKVSEVHRDENTNAISITAYDKLYEAKNKTVENLGLGTPYYAADFFVATAGLLGTLGIKEINLAGDELSLFYEEGANFNQSDTLRVGLDGIANTAQAIYYMDNEDYLVLKRLDKDGEPVFTIDKANYFTLDSGANRRLATIYHTTELGNSMYADEEGTPEPSGTDGTEPAIMLLDDASATTGQTGSTQYVRDNPFWELREDVPQLVEKAVAAIGGITINQFDCKWRGNPLLEPGDKIGIITKDDKTVLAYVLDDVIKYDGTYHHETGWHYEENDGETAANPITLGDALNKTYSKVDKVNKEIEMVVGDVEGNAAEISAIRMNSDSISSSVANMKAEVDNATEQVRILTDKVNLSMTPENVQILIQNELQNVGEQDSITTSTGYTFNEDGLAVSKSGSEMTTTITEDGMKVFRDEDEVLTANNTGVYAINLHANTYLIIGVHSRFEDYEKDGEARTGCFWIN